MDTKALRQKILDLAIRGKLVPQDPNDEPASVLLERIHAEKQQMVKDGKLKPKDIKNDTVIFKGDDNLHYEKFSDGTVKCIEDEIPFDIPDGWSWTRLIAICPYGETTKINANNITDNEWILELEDIEKDTGKILSYVLKSERQSVSQKHKFCKGQLLYSKLRPYLNKVLIAPKDGYCTSEILPLTLYGNISPEYIRTFLMSDTFLAYVDLISYGVKMPRLGTKDGKRSLIALPPLQEQFRIDTKLQESLEKIEYLKLHSNESEKIIKTIKSKILDLAIRGKLVAQDPNDEPASVLLERIRAEKEELIKQGKIKRNKKESVIFKGSDNSYYQDLPENWEICSIMAIAEVDLGKTLDKNKNTGEFYPYLRSVNIKWNEIDLSDIKEMQFEKNELQRYSIIKGDLLICEGGDVGRCCIWSSDETIYYQNALHRVRFHGGCEPKYFLYFMMYLEHTGYLKRISNGVTIKHLTKTVLTTIPFTLPPLAEQKRIVDEIEKIFAILDNIANQVA